MMNTVQTFYNGGSISPVGYYTTVATNPANCVLPWYLGKVAEVTPLDEVPGDRVDPDVHQTLLTNQLTALGGTRDEVAQTLTDGGYRGRMSDSSECPVARYLKSLGYLVSSTFMYTSVMTADGDSVMITTPTAVIKFMAEFDRGAYPRLVDTSLPPLRTAGWKLVPSPGPATAKAVAA